MCSPEALYAQLLFLSQDTKQNEAVDSLVDRPVTSTSRPNGRSGLRRPGFSASGFWPAWD
jgi:hypothetical protein